MNLIDIKTQVSQMDCDQHNNLYRLICENRIFYGHIDAINNTILKRKIIDQTAIIRAAELKDGSYYIASFDAGPRKQFHQDPESFETLNSNMFLMFIVLIIIFAVILMLTVSVDLGANALILGVIAVIVLFLCIIGGEQLWNTTMKSGQDFQQNMDYFFQLPNPDHAISFPDIPPNTIHQVTPSQCQVTDLKIQDLQYQYTMLRSSSGGYLTTNIASKIHSFHFTIFHNRQYAPDHLKHRSPILFFAPQDDIRVFHDENHQPFAIHNQTENSFSIFYAASSKQKPIKNRLSYYAFVAAMCTILYSLLFVSDSALASITAMIGFIVFIAIFIFEMALFINTQTDTITHGPLEKRQAILAELENYAQLNKLNCRYFLAAKKP